MKQGRLAVALLLSLIVSVWPSDESTYYQLLATSLLHSPADTPEPVPEGEEFDKMADAIKRVAECDEILDHREARYFLTRPEEYLNDLNVLRRRLESLSDAPRIAEACLLPPRPLLQDGLTVNRQHYRYAAGRFHVEVDRAWLWKLVMNDSDALYRVWDAARDAQCEFYYITVRRTALKNVRAACGPNYEMPPALPLWWFWQD